MFQDPLQKRANAGEQEALREIYARYSKKVYALTQAALGDMDSAKSAVKQIFLQLYREIMNAEEDLDLAACLSALTNEEVRLQRIARGDFSKDTLQIQYTVSAEDESNSKDTMLRIHERMVAADEEEEKKQKEFEDDVIREMEQEESGKSRRNQTSYRKPVLQEEMVQMFDEPKKKKGGGFITFLLILLVLVFLWLLIGILMDLTVLPFVDLGYSFFNNNIFEFFKIPQG